MSAADIDSAAALKSLRLAVGWESVERTDVVEQRQVDAFREATGNRSDADTTLAPTTFCVAFITEPPPVPGAETYGHIWLNGGDVFDRFVDLRVGDTVTSRARLESVEEKQGSSGLFVILSVVTDFYLPSGALAVRHTARRIRA